jgi:hypothetical protein
VVQKRKVESIFDYLGDVGGVWGSLVLIGQTLVLLFGGDYLDADIVERLFRVRKLTNLKFWQSKP